MKEKISKKILSLRENIAISNNPYYIGLATIMISSLYLLVWTIALIKILCVVIALPAIGPCWLIGKIVMRSRNKKPKEKKPGIFDVVVEKEDRTDSLSLDEEEIENLVSEIEEEDEEEEYNTIENQAPMADLNS